LCVYVFMYRSQSRQFFRVKTASTWLHATF